MFCYAQLNENNICIGVSQLLGENTSDNMILIEQVDSDYLWRKYENDQWSVEKYESQSTTPLAEFEQLRADVDQMIISNLS